MALVTTPGRDNSQDEKRNAQCDREFPLIPGCGSNCENQNNKRMACRTADLDKAAASASYSIKTIRMTAKNEETGAASCAADLYVVLPAGGTAKKPITYLVEKVLDEGGFNVTVRGLQ